MQQEFRRGDVVTVRVQGRSQRVEIDHVTADGGLAQCFWREGASKHYAMIRLAKVRTAAAPRPPAKPQASGRR